MLRMWCLSRSIPVELHLNQRLFCIEDCPAPSSWNSLAPFRLVIHAQQNVEAVLQSRDIEAVDLPILADVGCR